jgi:hypothetical protein
MDLLWLTISLETIRQRWICQMCLMLHSHSRSRMIIGAMCLGNLTARAKLRIVSLMINLLMEWNRLIQLGLEEIR